MQSIRHSVRAFSASAKRMGATTVSMKTNPSEVQGIMPASSGYKKTLQLQEQYYNNKNFVWQKRGMDKTLFNLTLALVLVCGGLVVQNVYQLAFAKKQN